VLPWTGHFDGSAFVKKCPGGIAPNCLEVDGVGWSPASSSEAGRACLEEGGYKGEDASADGADWF